MARSKWLEKFRQGSFKGIEFKTDSHNFVGGRRIQEHEFPQKEQNRTEDLGRKLRRFTLELLVIGDRYFTNRDALVEALESEGPGELIHPYLGRKRVQAGSFTLVETVGEGRLARFTVQFSEAGGLLFPEEGLDAAASLLEKANALIDDAKETLEDTFSVLNQPAFIVQAAADTIDNATSLLDTAVKQVTEPTANMTFAIRNLKSDINNLITRPAELADRVAEMFDTLLNEFSGDPDITNRVLGNYNSQIDGEFVPVIGDTPSRNTERTNQDSAVDFYKDIAFANQAKASVDIDFASSEASILTRDSIIDGLEDRLETASDDSFQSIKDLQSALTDALPASGTRELINFTPPKTLPALVISYTLFGDIEKEQEIVDQNAVEHPGFVLGGDLIEVSASG